ncbi:glutathione-disulfide reductase [Blastochloris tepida]|uniref:Glutathione reductase n=1 Tax=Blastochloris tepida TaxID=2233851 RepID=A0A348FYN1_9HYPH|nr:glutathione-disulfide reductase [Blastochloris tepida]BBF92414.1 glutathione-disulfide reductase [Blastochloris tepida]
MSEFDADLFVIGAGSGGVRAARIAAGYGAKVMVAEEFRVGGTCVIRGCVPKKLLVYAARFAHEFEDAAAFGWSLGEPAHDWAALIAAKDREIARLEKIYRANLERAGVTVIAERAVFADDHTVLLKGSGRRIRARHILIATGAHPIRPVFPGCALAATSNEAFDLDRLPRRVVVQGGGYIALEFAGIFKGLGAEVTVVHRGERVLRGFDEDVRLAIQKEMKTRGIRFRLGETIRAAARADAGVRVELASGDDIEADLLMAATGRMPNTSGLGLENTGVALDPRGAVAVDAFSRTSVPHIFAVGDVTGRVALTPVAIREGHAVADALFGGRREAVDYGAIPTAVFTEPEIGTVGATEAEARAGGAPIDIYKTSFRPMKATLSGRESKVFMKLVVDGATDRVLGIHIIGEAAAEMVQCLAIAVKMGAKKTDFDATMALHPSAAEELVTLRSKWQPG